MRTKLIFPTVLLTLLSLFVPAAVAQQPPPTLNVTAVAQYVSPAMFQDRIQFQHFVIVTLQPLENVTTYTMTAYHTDPATSAFQVTLTVSAPAAGAPPQHFTVKLPPGYSLSKIDINAVLTGPASSVTIRN